MRCIVIFVFCIPCFLANKVFSQKEKDFVIGTEYVFESSILGENRPYILSLPKSYAMGSKRYPVMVVLDGETHFHTVSGILAIMGKQERIPETILLAIPNTKDRTKDLTPTNSTTGYFGGSSPGLKTSGGGLRFLDFLEKELLKEIDEKFRTNSYRILAGHSLGGLMASTAYLDQNSSFSGLISIDPSIWWDNQVLVESIDSLDVGIANKKIHYMSTADTPERDDRVSNARNAHELYYAKLINKGVNYRNLKLQYFEDETHGSVPLLSFYYGLLYIFKDYRMDDIMKAKNAEIIKYYEEFSRTMEAKFLPPEKLVNEVANFRFDTSNDKSEALNLFKMNIMNYPRSSEAYTNLAKAYERLEKKDLAIEHFKIALLRDPENEEAGRKLRILEE